MPERPFSEAAHRNRAPIAEALKRWLPESGRLLELGSGTGQHACHAATMLPDWHWQPTEREAMLDSLHAGLEGLAPSNVQRPQVLDVTGEWPALTYDAVCSINTAHIMHWPEVEAMFSGVRRVLVEHGLFFLYGPFRRNGVHHADSNAAFDASLKARDPGMGVRDIEALDRLANSSGLVRSAELLLPANNHMLVFEVEATLK